MKAKRYAFRLRSRGDVPADFILASDAEQEIAQLEAVVKVADRMRLLVNDQTVAAREYDAALAALEGE